MNDISKAFLAIVGGAFTLAMVSVLISRNAATSDVLRSAGSALSGVIGAATAPVTNSTGGGGGNLASGGLLSGMPDLGSLGGIGGLTGGFSGSSFFSQLI